MKRLYATTDPHEAELLRKLLRDQGIESTLENDGGIHVKDEDAPSAAEALAGHFEKQEAHSEAPPPLTPEEDAAFEAKAKRRVYSKRLFLLLIFFWPGIFAIAAFFDEPWQMALGAAAGVLSLAAFIWVVDLIAENKTDPPPDSGNGSVEKPS